MKWCLLTISGCDFLLWLERKKKSFLKVPIPIKCPCESIQRKNNKIHFHSKLCFLYSGLNIWNDDCVLWNLNWSEEQPTWISALHYLIWYAWHIVHIINLSWQRFSAVCARSGPYPLCSILSLPITMARKSCFEFLAELAWGKKQKTKHGIYSETIQFESFICLASKRVFSVSL